MRTLYMDEGPEYLRKSRDLLAEITVYDSRIDVNVFAGNYDEEKVKRIISRVQNLALNQQYPILVIPDKNTKISFFAVKALASEAAMNYAKATAYIIKTFHHQIMADTFFSMYKTSKPVRVFGNEPAAMKWLGTFG
jgi:hypothetical protein